MLSAPGLCLVMEVCSQEGNGDIMGKELMLHTMAGYLYINVRMSRDCLLLRVCVTVCVCQIIASFSSFWAAVTLCTFNALSI